MTNGFFQSICNYAYSTWQYLYCTAHSTVQYNGLLKVSATRDSKYCNFRPTNRQPGSWWQMSISSLQFIADIRQFIAVVSQFMTDVRQLMADVSQFIADVNQFIAVHCRYQAVNCRCQAVHCRYQAVHCRWHAVDCRCQTEKSLSALNWPQFMLQISANVS